MDHHDGTERAGEAQDYSGFCSSPLAIRPLPSRSSHSINRWRPALTRQDLSTVVHELLEKETGESYPGLQESTSLREGLNLDSLDMAGLVLHVESRFGIQIETELLESIATVGDMLNVLERKLAATSGRQAA